MLRDSSNDYISASHIEYMVCNDDVAVTKCHYIATQVCKKSNSQLHVIFLFLATGSNLAHCET